MWQQSLFRSLVETLTPYRRGSNSEPRSCKFHSESDLIRSNAVSWMFAVPSMPVCRKDQSWKRWNLWVFDFFALSHLSLCECESQVERKRTDNPHAVFAARAVCNISNSRVSTGSLAEKYQYEANLVMVNGFPFKQSPGMHRLCCKHQLKYFASVCIHLPTCLSILTNLHSLTKSNRILFNKISSNLRNYVCIRSIYITHSMAAKLFSEPACLLLSSVCLHPLTWQLR